jgi:hypothetical protein
MSTDVNELMALSALLASSKRDLNSLVEHLNSESFPIARACAFNALQAVIACEKDLRDGGPAPDTT